jgi:hypothetical protein
MEKTPRKILDHFSYSTGSSIMQLQVALENVIVSQIRLKQLIVSSHPPSLKSPSPSNNPSLSKLSVSWPVILIIIMKHKAYISVAQLTDDTTTDTVPLSFILYIIMVVYLTPKTLLGFREAYSSPARAQKITFFKIYLN